MIEEVLRLHLEGFARKTPGRTEADVQVAIAAYLTVSEIGLAASQVSKVEEQLRDGTQRRIDISYGSLVIEVKKDLGVGKVLESSKKQLEGYLLARREKEGKSYAGIITDGVDWKLFYLGSEAVEEVDSIQVDPDSDRAIGRLNRWLQTILLTGERLKVTPERIVEKLGAESPRFKLAKAQMKDLYEQAENKDEILTKRGLWARLLRTALGTSFEDSLDLFIDHTLLVIEAEIIAHLVLGINPNEHPPEKIISGSLFRESGIFNVVAQDFFDWVGDSEDGRDLVKSLSRELQQFDWSEINHDVLKNLYEAVIDKETRKGLGEYYTPDWLAERVIDELAINWTDSRSMDPSCGSGTFLFHAVRRFMDEGESKGWSNNKIIERLQNSVFGLDIHPVSVVLARVTYLLAIGSDRLNDRGNLTVPVYLGDSMQWTRGANLMGQENLRVEVEGNDLAGDFSETMTTLFSSESVLDFPIRIVDEPADFDRLVSEMSTLAQSYTDFSKKKPAITPVLRRYKITEAHEIDTLTQTFESLCNLNAEGRDHIWGYFVRNQVRPVWLSEPENRMDTLFGNPPWVAYRFMTSSMQKVFKELSENRNLWVGGKLSTHQDLVGLFIARTVEQFLKNGGSFGFVTPFAVLSRPQYEGFRQGNWARSAPDGIEGSTQSVRAAFKGAWDLHKVKPAIFPVPCAVVFGTRQEKATALKEDALGFAGSPSSELETASAVVKQLGSGFRGESPYRSVARQGAIFTPRALVTVVEKDSNQSIGIPTGQVRVESQRSALEKRPWKDIRSLTGVVEKEFVFDILAGSSIGPFRVFEKLRGVLPVSGDRILDEYQLADVAPMTSKWWAAVAEIWELNRGKSKMTMIENVDYQSKLSKQLPGAQLRVVYTTSGTKLSAAIAEDRNQFIDTSLYWIPVATRREALYLCGILNSNAVQDEVSTYQSVGNFGPRHFHLLPLDIEIPRFDDTNDLHLQLADLADTGVQKAGSVALKPTDGFVKKRKLIQEQLDSSIQQSIDAISAQVLGG